MHTSSTPLDIQEIKNLHKIAKKNIKETKKINYELNKVNILANEKIINEIPKNILKNVKGVIKIKNTKYKITYKIQNTP